MHAVDGNLVFGYKITLNCLGQSLRALDTHGSGMPRVSFHFEDVSVLARYACGQIIELLLGIGGENWVAAAESDVRHL